MRFEYNKKELETIKKRLNKQWELIKGDKRPFFAKVVTNMYSSVMRNFKEQGTDKRKWKPLSLLTMFVRSHRTSKTNKKPLILQDTGRLKGSIYPEIGNDWAAVGTNVPYALMMQKGGVSQGNTANIKSFKRRHPITKQQTVRVRPYSMNIKSHRVEGRPFLHLRQDAIDRINRLATLWFFKGQ